MALTLEAEQRLDAAGLVDFFGQDHNGWLAVAHQSYTFVAGNFPAGSVIRRDDVAKALLPVVEVNEGLKDYLDVHKMRGKFWKQFFTDLVIDRTWDVLVGVYNAKHQKP